MTALVVILVVTMVLTALPVLSGRLIADARGQHRHRVALGVICGFGVLAGAVVFFGHAKGVSIGQAFEAAGLAGGLLVFAPIVFYLEIGYRISSRSVLAAVWVTSLVPLLVYLLLVAFAVANASECPNGETCRPLAS
jgi:hypothetical protein